MSMQGFAPRAAFSGTQGDDDGQKRKAVRRSALLEPNAAGIDIGAQEIYVAVPPYETSTLHAGLLVSPVI